MSLEHRRQVIHVFYGLAMILAGVGAGEEFLVNALMGVFFLGLFIIGSWTIGIRPGFIAFFLEAFERKNAKFPGQGALMFVTGALFLALFSPELEFTLAVIAILAFGDGFATLAGVAGNHRLSFNEKKTWEGVIGFFCAGAVAAGFFLPLGTALFYAALLSIVEAVDFPADDNVMIPLTAVFFRSFLGV